jgi:hypothetical protein
VFLLVKNEKNISRISKISYNRNPVNTLTKYGLSPKLAVSSVVYNPGGCTDLENDVISDTAHMCAIPGVTEY